MIKKNNCLFDFKILFNFMVTKYVRKVVSQERKKHKHSASDESVTTSVTCNRKRRMAKHCLQTAHVPTVSLKQATDIVNQG